MQFFLLFLFLYFVSSVSGAVCNERLREFLLNFANTRSSQILSPQTSPSSGIEIEGIIETALGRRHIAEVIQQSLYSQNIGSTLFPYTIPYKGFMVDEDSIEPTLDPRRWIVIQDRTIQAPQGSVGAELVSPILRNSADSEIFLNVVEALEKARFIALPKNTGLHVHIDFNNADTDEIAAVAILFREIAQLLLDSFSTAPDRLQWARTERATLNRAFEVFLLNGDPKRLKVYAGPRFRHAYRNMALNLTAISVHGTLEFRLFNSTLNRTHIQAIQNFCIQFVKKARAGDLNLYRYLIDNKESLSFNDLAHILELSWANDSSEILQSIRNEQSISNSVLR